MSSAEFVGPVAKDALLRIGNNDAYQEVFGKVVGKGAGSLFVKAFRFSVLHIGAHDLALVLPPGLADTV
jgi:hypothetical protein